MRTFPDVLPVPSWPDYGITPIDQIDRTDFETGEPRSRRRSLAERFEADLSWRLTDKEAGLFWPWYFDRAWSLSGDSDSLAGFTANNATLTQDVTTGPDGQLADRITEDTSASVIHAATLTLASVPLNSTMALRASIRAGTRSVARVAFQNWAGTLCRAELDLATGAWTGGANYLTRAVYDRGGGWWRIEMTASAGSGVTTPFFRINLMQAAGVTSYTGDGTSSFDVCEQQARVVSGGIDGHLRTGPDGRVLGADAGNAWFTMALPMGGGMAQREVKLGAASGMKPLNGGANWRANFKAMVR